MIAAILFIFYLIIILWSFDRLPLLLNSGLSRKGLYFLFAIKLFFGLSQVLVYTYYYTDRAYADVYKFFDDGNVIYESLYTHPRAALKVITGIGYEHEDPEIKDAVAATQHFDKKENSILDSNHRLLIRFNVIFRFFSYGNIYIHCLFFCFLSFIGLIALYRALLPFFENDTGRILLLPLFFIPSVLFWSSGMLKETLIILFLGMLFFTTMKLMAGKNILANLFLSALCLNFLYLSKPFIALSFLLSFYIMSTFHFKGYVRVISISLAAFLIMWFLYAHDTFICGIASSLIAKRNEFTALGLKMKAGSLADDHIYNVTCLGPLWLAPSGFYNLFCQPMVWSKGLFEKAFGLENMLVLLLSAATLLNFKKPAGTKLHLAIYSLIFFMVNYAIIGVSISILGALVRYKVFGLLFYLIMLLCLIDLNKIIFILKTNKSLSFISIQAKKLFF